MKKKSPIVIASLCREKESLYQKYVRHDAETTELLRYRISVTRRSECVPVLCNTPNVPIEEWIAPHDIKQYGDADEIIYRNIFRSGNVRIELQLKDMDGCNGSKVYYVVNPDWIHGDGERFIIPETAWVEYQKVYTRHIPGIYK